MINQDDYWIKFNYVSSHVSGFFRKWSRKIDRLDFVKYKSKIVPTTEIEKAKGRSDVGPELLLKGDPHWSNFYGFFFLIFFLIVQTLYVVNRPGYITQIFLIKRVPCNLVKLHHNDYASSFDQWKVTLKKPLGDNL